MYGKTATESAPVVTTANVFQDGTIMYVDLADGVQFVGPYCFRVKSQGSFSFQYNAIDCQFEETAITWINQPAGLSLASASSTQFTIADNNDSSDWAQARFFINIVGRDPIDPTIVNNPVNLGGPPIVTAAGAGSPAAGAEA